jgi:lipoyl-dependent peroxiredoxin
MHRSRVLRHSRLTAELHTAALVTLEQHKKGFRISRSALTLHASLLNLDQDTFLTQNDDQYCPVSRVLRAEIPFIPGSSL